MNNDKHCVFCPAATCNLPPILNGSCTVDLNNNLIPQPYTSLANEVILPITSYDLDDDTLTYQISDVTPDTSSFIINSTTGSITVSDILDRETQSSYFLNINVSDGMFEDILTVSVTVLDKNDNTPVPQELFYRFAVPENSVNNTLIGTVVCTDEDQGENSEILYTLEVLTPSNYLSPFRIDLQTGSIYTAVVLDYEVLNITMFTLQVTCSNPNGIGNTTTVTVTVEDENDNIPSGEVTPTIVEYFEGDDSVNVTVTIEDPDTFPILCANVILEGADNSNETLSLGGNYPGFDVVFMNNTLYISGNGTSDQYSTLLSDMRYSNPAEEFSGSLTRSITFIVTDRKNDTGTDDPVNIPSVTDEYTSITITVTLVPLNDPPVLMCSPVSLDPIDEDDTQSTGQSISMLFSHLITDSDNDNTQIGIAIIQSPMSSGGVLQIVDGNGTYTALTDASAASAYLLAPDDVIRFLPAPNVHGDYTFTFVAWDGTGNITTTEGVDTTAFSDGFQPFSSTNCTADITVRSINDPPVIEVANDTLTYVEGENVITSIDAARDAMVSDVDDTYLVRFTVNISSLDHGCEAPGYDEDSLDVFFCIEMPSVPVTVAIERYGPACVSYTFANNHTIANWQTIIQSCKFRIDNEEPSGHTRLMEYVVYDDEDASSPTHIMVDVILQNDNCPELMFNESAIMYIEHAGFQVITNTSLTLDDADSSNIQSATAVITSTMGPCRRCYLEVDLTVSSASLAQQYDESSLTLTITGEASISVYEAVLQTLAFEDRANEPDTPEVTVVVTVSDGVDANCEPVSPSNTISIDIMIIAIPDEEAIFYPNGMNETTYNTVFMEGGNPIPVASMFAMIFDPDYEPNAQSRTYVIDITLDIGCGVSELQIPTLTSSDVVNTSDCYIRLRGDASSLETDLMQIRFFSSSGNPTPLTHTIEFALYDLEVPTYSYTEVSIIPVNDAPVVDLNTTNSSIPNTIITFDISQGVTSTVLVGGMGSAITDVDDDYLQSLTFELQEFSNGSRVLPRTGGSRESIEPPSNLASYGLSSTNFNQLTSLLVINGNASLADYTTVLDTVIYQNLESDPSRNIRIITVVASDGTDSSDPAQATIVLTGQNNPPMIENVLTRPLTYFANDPAIVIAPDISIIEVDNDLICSVNITGDCDFDSLDFSDIMYPDLVTFVSGTGYLQLHTMPFSCLRQDTFSSILQSIKYFSDTSGSCSLMFQATEARGLVSEVETVTINSRIRNIPPRVDHDLGVPGTGFSTCYMQDFRPVHIVSIFNATLNSTISPQFFEGEAMGEAGEAATVDDPGISLSHAGYLIEDDDDTQLAYLRASIVQSSTRDDDVLVFPCIRPGAVDDSLEARRGCDGQTPSSVVGGTRSLEFNATATDLDTCVTEVDICTGLRVDISCPLTGYKRYMFTYSDNSSIVRFRALLGCIGYEYLVEVGGFLNHIRNVEVVANDGESDSNVATTMIQVKPVNRLVFRPTPVNLSVCEGEKTQQPNRPNCVLMVARPMLLRGGFADPAIVDFSIVDSSNPGYAFAINSNGEVYLNNSLDREERDNYTLLIDAVTLGGEARLTVNVTVEDVNDNHPEIAESYKVEVPEDRSNYPVINLNATDRDLGSNAELFYFIVGYGSDRFTINSTTGEVRTSVELMSGDIYVLVIIITDRGDIIRHRNDTYQYFNNDVGGLYLSTHTIVTVEVTDVFRPTIFITPNNISRNIQENQAVGTVVASFEARNNDTMLSNGIQYTIVSIDPSGSPDPFELVPNGNGRVNVTNTITLDAEAVTQYNIRIMAANTSTNMVDPGYADLTVLVGNENDNYPQFINLPDTLSLPEDTTTNTVVFSFMVSDDDIEGTVYAFDLSGTIDFGVSGTELIESEGTLTNVNVSLVSQLDYETTTSGYLTVTVQDGGTPLLSNSSNITITVQDVNDNLPVPINNPTIVDIIETTPNGTMLLNISTLFTDVDTVGEFNFDLTTNDSIPFCIEGDLLMVCDADILTNVERGEPFIFEVAVENPPLSPVSLTIIVNVLLVNEFEPEFSTDVYDFTVTENTPNNTNVGPVSATDDDGGDHGIIVYTFNMTGVTRLPFSIDPVSGTITTNGGEIDRESDPSYSVQVIATDNPSLNGNIQFTSSAIVNITVIDLNDNAPVFVGAPYTILIDEYPGTVDNANILEFDLTDRDTPAVSTLQLTLPPEVSSYLSLYTNESYEYSLIVTDAMPLDYDTGSPIVVFNITALDNATDVADDSHEVMATVTITLRNVNDNPPVIHGPMQIAVNEVSGDGSGVIDPILIGQVNATDNDMNELTYSISDTVCTDSIPFNISSSTGDLFLCIHIDYETNTSYVIPVEVFDGIFSDSLNISVTVVDRNDNPPIISDPVTFEVNENATTGMFVGAIPRTDLDSPDNSRATFIGQMVPMAFRLDTDGRLYINDSLLIDRETQQPSYMFNVTVVNLPLDPTDETQTTNVTVIINIVDVNEHRPIFLTPCDLIVEENADNGTSVGTVNATDSDPTAMLSYLFLNDMNDETGITECTINFPFQIGPTTGEVTVCNEIDFEERYRYGSSLVISITDGINPIIGECFLTIIDLNDVVPIIDPPNATITTSEFTDPHSFLIGFDITDGDGTSPNREVTGSFIIPSSVPFYLEHNNTDLSLFLNSSLDYEMTRSYSFNIIVDNLQLNSTPTSVEVNVINENDLPPVFDLSSFNETIFENVNSGYQILMVVAADPDMAPGPITYSVEPLSVPFTMNGSTLVVRDHTAIDHDDGERVYYFNITATDSPTRSGGSQQTSYIPGEVHVLDVNDNAPQFDINSLNYTLREDAMQMVFGMIRTMDRDSGANMEVNYTAILPSECLFIGESGSGAMEESFCSECFPFSVDPSTGNISLCADLDYEIQQSYEFDVIATDMGTPSMSANATITIIVVDVNDNSPRILNRTPLERISLREDETVPSPVIMVNATDDDSGENSILNYTLSDPSCTEEVPFMIDSNGYLILCHPLDYERRPNHTFDIIVYDNGGPPRNDTVTVVIIVINVNDNDPIITSPAVASVYEEQPDEFVINVEAEDPDAPLLPITSYELDPDSQVNFTINETTGEIRTRGPLDREVAEYLIVTVIVYDQDFNISQDITVTILDINDNDPVVTASPMVDVTENVETIINITATDQDSGNNSALVYTLVNASIDISYFSIDATDGSLTIQPIDRDPDTGGTPQVVVDIEVADSGSTPRSTDFRLTIDVTDVNDNVPVFTNDERTIYLDEGTATSTMVYTVMASDSDEGSNANLTYSVINGTNLLNFVPGTPQLEVVEVPILNSTNELMTFLEILIQDWNMDPDNRSMTEVILTVVIQSPRPVFPAVITFPPIPENSDQGQPIGVAQARVRGVIELLNYTIISELPFGEFSIDNNGTISSPQCSLDYEDAINYSLVVGTTVINDASLSDITNVNFELINVNEYPPVLFPLNLTGNIAENSSLGTTVLRVKSIDLDFGQAGMVSYSILNSDVFIFNNDTGDLTLNQPGVLNHEVQQQYILQYQALDHGNPTRYSDIGYIVINVTNVDDVPPVAVCPEGIYRVRINETVNIGFPVLTISATDVDTPQDNLVFSLNPSQTDFAINPNTGEVVTASLLDHETRSIYDFMVVVTDTRGFTDVCNISVVLYDNNDNRPQIRPAESCITIREDMENCTTFPENISIYHADNTALYPVLSITASLKSTENGSFPLGAGVCDHANYSLYDDSTAKLCNSGATDLIDFAQDSDLASPGILQLDGSMGQVVVLNHVSPREDLTSGFCLCMWFNIPASAKSLSRSQLFRFNPGGLELAPLRLSIRQNTFQIGIQRTLSSDDFITPIQIPLNDDSYPDFIDGTWHHLCVNYNGSRMELHIDGELQSSHNNVTLPSGFTTASPILGEFLTGFVSQLLFQPREVCTEITLRCLVTCGEWLDIDGSASLENVLVDVDYQQRCITLTYTGTENVNSTMRLDEALQAIKYYSVLDEPHPLDRLIMVSASDAVDSGNASLVIVKPVLRNDKPPVLDLTGLEDETLQYTTTYVEDTVGIPIVSQDTVLYDRDSGYWVVYSIKINIEDVDSNLNPGILEVIDSFQSPLQAVVESQTCIVINATDGSGQFPELFVDALMKIHYSNPEDEPTLTSVQITFAVDDGSRFSNPTAYTTVTIRSANDPPAIDLNAADPNTLNNTNTFEEEVGSRLVIPSDGVGMEEISDDDGDMLSEAVVTIVNRPDGNNESLEIEASVRDAYPSITAETYDSATGELRLTGIGSYADYLALLKAVRYINTESNPGNPDPAPRLISFLVTDADGGRSTPAFIIMSIDLHNDPPIFWLDGVTATPPTVTYLEDSGCLQLFPNAIVRDVDEDERAYFVRLSLRGTPEPTANEHLFTNVSGSARINNRTFSLYLSDSANPVQELQNLFRNTYYCNEDDEPGNLTREVEINFIIRSSRIFRSSINIMSVNDPPEIVLMRQVERDIGNETVSIISSFTLDDSDDTLFCEMVITIVNPLNERDEEIIDYDPEQLPVETFIEGPNVTQSPRMYRYFVQFRGSGGDFNKINETILRLGYQNLAPFSEIDTSVARNICITLNDCKLFGPPACVSVEISPFNEAPPVFLNSSGAVFRIRENNDPFILGTVVATDSDSDLAGEIGYSIRVYSRLQSGPFSEVTGLVDINPSTGTISVLTPLDAETTTELFLTVVASDRGNPPRSSEQLNMTILVEDENDEAPSIQVDLQISNLIDGSNANSLVAFITVTDADITGPNNDISQISIVDGPLDNLNNPLFSIVPTGNGGATLQLDGIPDYEVSNTYRINISSTDGGTPSNTAYMLVEIRVEDRNDQVPVIHQIIEGRYVVNSEETTSIGPVQRIIDTDESPTIESVQVTLQRHPFDLLKTFSNCEDQRCQLERMDECGLIRPNSIDLTTSDVSFYQGLFINNSAEAGCHNITLNRGLDDSTTGRGNVRSPFPSGSFVNFTMSFVTSQISEGFPFVINDNDVPTDGSRVPRYMGIWLRRSRYDFYYSYIDVSNTRRFANSRVTGGLDIFHPDNVLIRHIAVVVEETNFKLYVNCELVSEQTLDGIIADPPAGLLMDIGTPQPNVLNNGAYAGSIADFFYHNYSMTAADIECTCSCGNERLVLPDSLPSGLTATESTVGPTSTITVTADTPVSLPVMEEVLRDIGYINTFTAPNRTDPKRQLDFFLSDGDQVMNRQSPTMQCVLLVDSNDNTPIISITGGAVFVEDSDAVNILTGATIRRQDGLTPPIFNMTVRILNGQDIGERLSGDSTIVVNISGSGTSSLTLVGAATPDNYTDVLRSITYFNPADVPDTNTTRRIEFCANGHCSPSIAEIQVMASNDNPFTIPPPSSVTYVEDSDPILFATGIEVGDVDSDMLISAQVSVQTSPSLDDDYINYSGTLPAGLQIIRVTNSSINITGVASVDNYQTALRNLVFSSSYNPLLDNEGNPLVDTTRSITFTVSDDMGGVSTQTEATINFTPRNSPPMIITTGVVVYIDGSTSVLLDPSITIIDDDNDQLRTLVIELTTSFSGNEELRYENMEGLRLAFNNQSRANFINILRSVLYINRDLEPELASRSISIEVCDFTNCTQINFVVNVTDSNDNVPMFTASPYFTTIGEDTSVNQNALVVTVTDADRSPSTFTFAITDLTVPFTIVKTTDNTAAIRVASPLDFEMQSMYIFNITVRDGGLPQEQEGSATVTIEITNANENPTIDLSADEDTTYNQTGVTRYTGTPVRLLAGPIDIYDIDNGDEISEARICITNAQNGDEILFNTTASVNHEIIGDCLVITGTALTPTQSAAVYEALLDDIEYQNTAEDASNLVLRLVSVEVYDTDGLVSNIAYTILSLANLPEFDQELYNVSLMESVSHPDFLTVVARVQGETDTIRYELQPGVTFVSIRNENGNGILSVDIPLDYEDETEVSFDVLAIDTIPPPRTATAVVTIYVIDVNDNPPNISFSGSNATVNSNGTLDIDIVLTDEDTFPLHGVIIELESDSFVISTNPCTGETCLDIYNAYNKMSEACGLDSSVENLINASSPQNSASVNDDSFGNIILQNIYEQSHAIVDDYDISGLQGNFTELTFAVWININPGQSGYIISVTNSNGHERYFSVYFISSERQIRVYLKDPNLSGQCSIIAVVFQLDVTLDDGEFHFIMLYIQNGQVELVIDATRITCHQFESFTSHEQRSGTLSSVVFSIQYLVVIMLELILNVVRSTHNYHA